MATDNRNQEKVKHIKILSVLNVVKEIIYHRYTISLWSSLFLGDACFSINVSIRDQLP